MYGRFHATIQCVWLSEIVDVNVGIKNHNFNVSLILDKCNIMIVMQKLKFMLEFTFAINVECLHNSLHAKLLMHNCAHAKHAKKKKHVFVPYIGF